MKKKPDMIRLLSTKSFLFKETSDFYYPLAMGIGAYQSTIINTSGFIKALIYKRCEEHI